MSLYLTNPISMTGERGLAPEYESDNPCKCSRCSDVIDRDDEILHEVPILVRNGRRVPPHQTVERICETCMERCEGCLEDLDADSAELRGPAVSLRFDESDGHRKPYHAWCGASYLLGSWLWPDEPEHFDAEMASREQIAEMVAAASGKAVVA